MRKHQLRPDDRAVRRRGKTSVRINSAKALHEREHMEESQPIWLTVKQAAARAQVAPGTIYHEVRAGRLRAARIGGRRELRFRESYIDAWLEQSAQPQEDTRAFPRGTRIA